jgi:hypothetical protein
VLLLIRLRPVHDDASALERDQAAPDHGIELRQNRLDLLFGLDAFDYDRQVEREDLDPIRVEPRRRAEAHDRAQHGGAGVVTTP